MNEVLKRKILNWGIYWISYLKLIPILKDINKESTIIDCGANRGDITALFAKRGAKVYAFEPDPLAFQALVERFKKNKNVVCFQKGVWDRNGKETLYFHRARDKEEMALTVSSSLIKEKVNIDANNGREVEIVDLTEFIENLRTRVDLIKIDIEGAEIQVLKKIIRNESYKKTGQIFVETHENKISSQKKDIKEIKQEIRKRGIGNIILNWT